MQAFQKQAEAHLAQTVTGLVVSTLPAMDDARELGFDDGNVGYYNKNGDDYYVCSVRAFN